MTDNNILIIEDDIDYGLSLQELLNINGYQATLATSTKEGLKKFHEEKFDVCLIDIKLPDRDGVQCYLEMLQHDHKTKAIMMTGYHDDALIKRALEYGALSILSKPFSPASLFNLLSRITGAQNEPKVLLAEDDADLADSIKEYLAYNHYDVVVAYNGEDAVKRALQDDIDVMVLDLRLPMVDGLTVYRRLKMCNKSIPTIISTAYAHEEHAQIDALLADNEMLTLSKPYNPDNLLRAIEQLRYV